MRLPEGAANPFRSLSSAFGSAAVSRRGRQPGGWRCECCRGVGSRGVWAVEARELCVQEPVVVCFVVICCSCSRDSAVRCLSVIPVAPPVGVAWFRGPWVAAWRLVSVRSGRGGGPGGWRSGWLRGQPGPAFRASGPGGFAAVRRGITPLQSPPGRRGVAQSGRAPGSGSGGRRFKSCRPDAARPYRTGSRPRGGHGIRLVRTHPFPFFPDQGPGAFFPAIHNGPKRVYSPLPAGTVRSSRVPIFLLLLLDIPESGVMELARMFAQSSPARSTFRVFCGVRHWVLAP